MQYLAYTEIDKRVIDNIVISKATFVLGGHMPNMIGTLTHVNT